MSGLVLIGVVIDLVFTFVVPISIGLSHGELVKIRQLLQGQELARNASRSVPPPLPPPLPPRIGARA
jgi:hypothetical protein